MNTSDYKVLNEIYKGNKMGMDAITYMEDKIKDDQFRIDVKNQYNGYKGISEKIENLMNQSNDKLEDTPIKDKVMGCNSVKTNTMIDDTTSHMSEMLIQGTVMGIVEGVKVSNQNPDLDKEAKQIVDEFIKIGEDNIQTLKKYL